MKLHDIDDWDRRGDTLTARSRPRTPPRQSRKRSTSTKSTTSILPATAVPSTDQNEALSTLIASLTSISDAAKEGAPEYRRGRDLASDTIQKIALDTGYQATPRQDIEEGDNNDVAPFPVAGYSIYPHVRPKIAVQEPPSWPGSRKKSVEGSRRGSKSSAGLRPVSPRSGNLYTHSNNSGTSVATSTLSTSGRRKRSLFGLRLRKDSFVSEREVYSSAASIRSYDEDMEAQSFSAFVRVENIDTKFTGYASRSPAENKNALPSINTNKPDDTTEHRIPSRRSSLRHSKQPSATSKDFAPLSIEEDVTEGDSETLQRIRELQKAKEQRQAEWRREAKMAGRSTKRGGLPTPSPPEQQNLLRASWYARVVESVQADDEDQTTPDKPAPALKFGTREVSPVTPSVELANEQPSTPVGSHFDRRSMSITQRSLTPSFSSTHRHKKKLSDSIKRTGSLRKPPLDDVQVVEDEVEAFLASPRLTQRIRHPRTGRTIAFSEVGESTGHPVICCVGMGLTRYVMTFYDDLAKTHKLRLITPDRPGVGESSLMDDNFNTPLGWVDDVAVICSSLGIEKFSLLAHSAGALYALATALKMPQYARGRIHLMAPWIPPSQLALSGPNSHVKPAALPTSHKVLSLLPTAFMKAANSRFLHATSAASVEPKSKRERRKNRDSVSALVLDTSATQEEASLTANDLVALGLAHGSLLTPDATPHGSNTPQSVPTQTMSAYQAQSHLYSPPLSPTMPSQPHRVGSTSSPLPRTQSISTVRVLAPEARHKLYNQLLTSRTWTLSTLNANPALDLIICLERRRPIGYRYTDITRPVVIHHGVNDTRVPKENVTWLAAVMKRAELRVLDGEGHGLMASANVMAGVLAEIGKEWDEYATVVERTERERRQQESRETQERERELRRGRPRY